MARFTGVAHRIRADIARCHGVVAFSRGRGAVLRRPGLRGLCAKPRRLTPRLPGALA